MSNKENAAWHCLICNLILLEEGYTPDEALAIALKRHPKALEYYKPKCNPENSAATPSTTFDATAAAPSSNPTPRARSARAVAR